MGIPQAGSEVYGPFHWQAAPQARFAVIGDPIHHSLSPRMQTAALDRVGLPDRYVAIHVRAGEVGTALEELRDLGYEGINVTVPHKAEALEWLVSSDRLSKRIRAVNTLSLPYREGINTDGPGFLETLDDLGVLPGARVVILGAGGSARAVAASCADAGYRLALFNRTAAKAEALVEELCLEAELLAGPELADADVVVNATSAELSGAELDLDWDAAPQTALAYDLMYAKEPTGFVRRAEASGRRAIDGRRLLVAQGALAFEWWLGIPAPRAVMLSALQ